MPKYALVIGIPSYSSRKFAALPKTTTDAEKIAQILEQHGGFSVTRLPAQGNEQSDAYVMKASGVSQDHFVTTLKQFLKRASGHDALIYFTGHGYTVVDELDSEDERGYLATNHWRQVTGADFLGGWGRYSVGAVWAWGCVGCTG
jgi:uncharacterized caspase-like protein